MNLLSKYTWASTFSKFIRPEMVDRGRISDGELDIIEAVLRYRFSPTSEVVRLIDGNEDFAHRRPLEKAQIAIAKATVTRFELSTDVLAFDRTNFDTHIATVTPGKLACRGHAKNKRRDLREVGLGVLVSETGHVPLLHPPQDQRLQRNGVVVRVIEYRLEGVEGSEPLYRRGARIILRSKTPDLVGQEFYGLLMAHFAIRGLMHEAALASGEDPDRLSLPHAVRVIRRNIAAFGAISPSGPEEVPSSGAERNRRRTRRIPPPPAKSARGQAKDE